MAGAVLGHEAGDACRGGNIPYVFKNDTEMRRPFQLRKNVISPIVSQEISVLGCDLAC